MRVIELFDSLQGEGVWAGVPMTFIRLAGCNAPQLGLACVSWCDTAESWDPAGGHEMDAAALLPRVRCPRACITGGEPLLQAGEVAGLAGALARRGVKVHLETNGSLDWPQDAPPPFWTAVSPKPPAYGIAGGIAATAGEVKIVYDAGLDALPAAEVADVIRHVAAQVPAASVCIQPEASGGAALARRAAELVMANPQWRLSMQLHKVLGLR